MPDDELPEMPPEPEDAEPQPPKEKIRIVELSGDSKSPKEKICKVCGKLKPVYVEMESRGITEYTCKDCFAELTEEEKKQCRSCDATLKFEDAFCGKCGEPTIRKCPKCDARVEDEDLFCGKCGAKL